MTFINLANLEKAFPQKPAGPISILTHRYDTPLTVNGDMFDTVETIDVMTKEMRALVKKIQDLRHLGIEDSKIAFPKICVVGDQSTGKSSLIEGMSEIKVPRSAGTCTRCPMEINLSDSDEPWKCKVSLSFSHTYSTKGGLRKISKQNKLGPWHEEPEPEDLLFITLDSKDLVQDAIRRAQLAILNPHRDPAEFLPTSSINIDEATTHAKFSPNVVRLDISALGFPNLAFYDLPGVISQAEVDEEAYLVTLVENLVKHYVSQENCIILLTLPMTDDATNSSAARIVREVKATHRTLGVLTKPDRVEEIEQWADILNGNKFHLGCGYYVVRNNPNPAVEHRQARSEEDIFFSTCPWTTALAPFQSRFGTRNLQSALSRLLIQQIKECLPSVKVRIKEKAQMIQEELRTLPEPVNQSTFYSLCSKMQELKGVISDCFEPSAAEMPLLKIWKCLSKDFASTIQRTKPALQILTKDEMIHTNEEESDCEIIEPEETKPACKRKLSLSAKTLGGTNKTQLTYDFTEHFRAHSGKYLKHQ